MSYYIYLIENDIDEKQYVGSTRRSLPTRLKEHKAVGRSCLCRTALQKAIKQYGAEHFSIRLLEKCKSEQMLSEAEIRWIAVLGTLMPAGFNMNPGRPWRGPLYHSEETKRKMSQSKLGKKFTEAHKKAMSINHHDVNGPKHPRWGKHLSEETKEKIRRPQVGKFVSNSTRQKMSAAWTDARRAACKKLPRMATCHPDQKHQAKGLCQKCYDYFRRYFKTSSSSKEKAYNNDAKPQEDSTSSVKQAILISS